MNLECPLCEKEIYSDLGRGCKMCGMPVDYGEKFCSNKCKVLYIKINR